MIDLDERYFVDREVFMIVAATDRHADSRPRRVDEHMIVERRDGSLWMLLRNTAGIALSVSTDGGRTWCGGALFMTGGIVANKRALVRRLQSVAFLNLRHDVPTNARSHLTAFVYDHQRYSLNHEGREGNSVADDPWAASKCSICACGSGNSQSFRG